MAKNVTELHQFLFGKEDYDPSDEVKEANDAIIELTGLIRKLIKRLKTLLIRVEEKNQILQKSKIVNKGEF